jgi:hypothetical protein
MNIDRGGEGVKGNFEHVQYVCFEGVREVSVSMYLLRSVEAHPPAENAV